MAIDREVNLKISALTDGGGNIRDLAKEISDLAAKGGAAAPEFQKLGKELDSLAHQQDLITQFTELKRQSSETAAAMTAATAATKSSAQSLREKESALAAATASERAATVAVTQQKDAISASRLAIAQAKETIAGYKAETEKSGGATKGWSSAIAESKAVIAQNNAAITTAKNELNQLVPAQKAQAAAVREAATAVANSTASFNANKAAAGALKDTYTSTNAAIQATRTQMQALGVNSSNLVQAQLALKAAVTTTRGEVNALIPAYARAGQQAAQTAQQQKQASVDAAAGIAAVGNQLAAVRNIAAVAVGGGFLGGMIKDALATADTINNVQARIKLATGEGDLFKSSFAELGAIALRTNTNLEQTGTLFQRITEAGKSAGLATRDAATQSLALTETINQSIQLSGGSADSAKAAITQLIQGLQSGVLRGEEFNSVMEQSPRLAKALADGLGRTTGELRKMAEAGALSTSTVISALQNQSDAIKAEFASLPPTVGRAVENLRTSWSLYIGDLDKGSGITKNVAAGLNGLAGNLNVVIEVASKVGAVWAAYAASQGLASAAAKQSAIAALQQGESSAVAAASTGAHGKAAAAAAIEVTAYGAASRAAGAGLAATTATTAASATGWRALAGGVLGAASKLTLWGTVAYVAIDTLKETGKALGEGAARWMGYRDAEAVMAEQEKKSTEAIKAATEERIRQAAATKEAENRSYGLGKAAGDLAGKFELLVKNGDSATEAISKIGKDFDLSKIPGMRDAAGVLDKLLATGKITAAEFSAAWTSALKGEDLAVFEAKARAAFTGSAREAQLLAQMLDATLRESIRRTGLDFDVISGGAGKAAISASNDLEIITRSLGELGKKGVDTGLLLNTAIGKAINAADSKSAVDSVISQIEGIRKVLGDKIADGFLDQAKQKILDLGDAADRAAPGINSLREAYKQLGVQTTQELSDIASKNKAAWEEVRKDGTASADTLGKAFAAYAESALAASGSVGSAQREVTESLLRTEAAVKGLTVSFDDNGKMILKAKGDLDSLGGSLDGAANKADRLASSLQRVNNSQGVSVMGTPSGGDFKDMSDFQKNGGRNDTFTDSSSGITYSKNNQGQMGSDGVQKGFTVSAEENRFWDFKEGKGNLTEADRKYVEANWAAAQANYETMQANRSAYSAKGLDSAMQKYNEARRAMEALNGAGLRNVGDMGSGGFASPGSGSGGFASSHTVNINLGGSSKTINTASAADSQALSDLLKKLESDMKRAS